MFNPDYLYQTIKRQQAAQTQQAALETLAKRSRQNLPNAWQRTRQSSGKWRIKVGTALTTETLPA